jgi:site-specific recombinase XerC
MARKIDPMRRALPISEWPTVDCNAWQAALTCGDAFEDGGGAVDWAAKTRLTNISHYGRWLGYLRWRGLLGDEESLSDRVTRDRVRDYVNHLEMIVAPHTCVSMLIGLKVMMQVMTPESNWNWLQKVCNRIQRAAKPTSNKLSRMRPTTEIFKVALRELRRLPSDPLSKKDALRYRDALMLAFLASRPLRRKNCAALELGRNLVKVDGGWLLTIPAEETKTGQAIAFLLPEILVPWLERYLVVRKFPVPGELSSKLWLSNEGKPLNGNRVWSRITKLTQRLFGKSINPHLLRDCAASTLANSSSDLALAAAPLLGHRHFATTERFYIQANNLEASRRFNSILSKLRTDETR